jgi:hypothetical protein
MTARQEVEKELILAVEARQTEWQIATDETRDVARQRFLKALQIFTAFKLMMNFQNAMSLDIQKSDGLHISTV